MTTLRIAAVPELKVVYDPGTEKGDYETMLFVELWPDGHIVVVDEIQRKGTLDHD
jgi:hypothetical protein